MNSASKTSSSNLNTILIGVLFICIGSLLIWVSWSGLSQLRAVATAQTSKSISDFPLVEIVFNFYAPRNSPVKPAAIALRVQITFFVSGLLGLLFVVVGIWNVIRSPPD